MDRPSTSKARGVCKYYQTPRGCFAGDKCKFLHGDSTADTKDPSTRLTPYDQAKVCRYFANGFCKHGDKCWFRHIPPPQPDETVFATDPIDESCSICFEKPAVYGLLTGCSHVFCIPCLKEWRDPRDKSEDVVQSGVHKKCPMCRTPSKFITPSSLFYKHDDPRKTQTISAYKDSMARVPCRYFVESKTKSKKLFCPFGKDCFYQHLNDDGTPYTFADGVEASMRRARQNRERRTLEATDDLLNDILFGVNEGSIQSPFDIIGRFGRFLDEPRLSQFSNDFAALFRGRFGDSNVSPQDNAANSDGTAAVSWLVDGTPVGDIRVTVHNMDDHNEDSEMPHLEPIFPTRQASGHSSTHVSSSNDNHVPGRDDAESEDESLPALVEVSDSEESSPDWSENGSDDSDEVEFDTLPTAPDFPTSPTSNHDGPHYPAVILSSIPPFYGNNTLSTLQSTQGHGTHFPRPFLIPSLRDCTPEARQETATVEVASNSTEDNTSIAGSSDLDMIDDLPPLQPIPDLKGLGSGTQTHDESNLEGDCHPDHTDDAPERGVDGMPALEPLHEVSTASKSDTLDHDTMPALEPITNIAADDSPRAFPADDAVDRDVPLSTPPPFTTDGRGRVIAANDSDEGNNAPGDGRTFLSRMLDVLF
ncbi:hypothetical protein F5878DRAFT_19621 [Lentinula raphanica]|uniref:RING-type E3 ubiquitin transferase n=1 Tax=Lentinula raphanica TaxID=153919 RepID=A0AA38PEA8_9AGAR|nr:hypothetical protein F5878DRAFT_19621 [Lentinula raphanica]